MSWKLRALISATLWTPAVALGLGLGEIRLNSALNEPLSAEIDLVAATPEELAALKAELASSEVFERYGLDRPAYLGSIDFRVGRGQDGRSVLQVRSRDAMSEPFVSFLVDVNWARGRLLREYTVLLDPPVLAAPSASRTAEPIAAPTTMPSSPPRAPAPVAAPSDTSPSDSTPAVAAPATAAPATAAPADNARTHRVERGDTLYEIAGSMTGGDRPATQRLMLGLFRANPEAFGGNINHLRAGAILRVPDATEYADIAPADAAIEVRRQTAAWREAGGGAPSGQLRLVTPEEGVADAGTGEPDTSGKVESQIESLEREIAEQRRLLELRNQELAQLQRNLGERRAAEAAAAEKAAAEKAAADKAAADKAAADRAAVPPPAGEAPVAPEDSVTPAPPKPEPRAPVAKAPVEVPPPTAEPSYFEKVTENWMFLLGAAGLLLIGILGFGYFRRRRDEDVSVALKGFDLPESAPIPSETTRLRTLATGEQTAELERPTSFEDQDQAFVVEERPIARPKAEAPRPVVGHDETISAEAALNLDQADPLAEADFHMAYGLYDQAVDLIRMALQRSPDRNDLKLKLAEIHFVAGDVPQFLAVARDLRKTLGPGGDWDRIVIMGSQLAPSEPMFAGGVQDAGVDLSLEGGDNLVDLDLLSTPDGEGGLDLDLGRTAVMSDSEAATGENTAVEFNFDIGPASPTTTQEIVRRGGPGTVEMPTLELPSSETPTVETPALKRQKQAAQPSVPTDATAEMAIDDLGIDHGHLGELTDAEDATAFSVGIGDDSTMIGRRDDGTQRIQSSTDDEGTALLPIGDMSATAMLPKFDMDEVDLDVGNVTDDSDAAPTARDSMVSEIPRLSELEPVTMSEVGTKLDLARAYMDMGDPDGARNILQEVLSEGSASQKQEARRLIDSLPGA